MDNERHSKVQSICHLPEELCREVLLRLPVKSLLRFRCVSKSWLSLTQDPEFCRVHMRNFKNNRDLTDLLVVQGGQLDCFVRCSDTFKIRAGTLVTVPPRCRGGGWMVECSVDGLVLLKGLGRNDLVVWNPSIRKFHDIPSPPVNVTTRNSTYVDISLGLGYDPCIKDYKYVKLIFDRQGAPLQSVEVYTLGESSWKTIQYQGKESSNWNWDPPLNATYMRGCFYFIRTNSNSNVSEMVYFDLRTEGFGSIGLPPVLSNPSDMDFLPSLVGYGTSLALFDLGWGANGSLRWAVLDSAETENESLTWTKPCSVDMDIPLLLFLKKNLDMLLWWRDEKMSFNLAVDKSFEELCCVVSSYNLETGEEKMLHVEKQEDDELIEVYGYIESLVLLN